MAQVGGGVVDLCPMKYSHWNLRVMHALLQILPILNSCGRLFAGVLQILLQTLFWFGNKLPTSMGQFRGVTIGTPEMPKLSPIRQNCFHYPIGYLFVPNLEITFLLNAKEKRKPCQER